MILLALLLMQAPEPMREAPVEWTRNYSQYVGTLAAPKATSCEFWGALANGKKCEAYLVFDSIPKHLKCHVDQKFDNVVVCTWDKPHDR